MSYNGAGLFVIDSTGQPVAASTLIQASVFNALTADLATGLSTAIAKDGQTTITANLPMAGYRHTGVGNASARTMYAAAGQVQDGGLCYGTVGGTADAITLTLTPAITAYAAGQKFSFVSSGANTGAVTINVNSVGAKDVTKNGTTALAAGDIASGAVCVVVYDGTRFQLLGQMPSALTGMLTFKAGADIASAATIDLTAATGNMPRVTGTTATSAATMNDGQLEVVTAAAAWPLTYHATNMRVITLADYTCTAEEPVMFYKDGSGVVHVWPALAGGGGSAKVQEFRLTLQSSTPVPNSDQTSKATIYCTPYVGNSISLYTGSAWVTRTSAEFSLALGTLTSGKPYDVFCYDNSGTPTLEFLAWTSDTARATALAFQDGVYVKSGDATRRYLGTFFTTSTTTTEDSMANRCLYNYYNRVTRPMGVVDATGSWTYTTATYRQMRATSTNALNFMQGVDEDGVSCNVSMSYSNTSTGVNAIASIGLDSTSSPISTQLRFAASNSYVANLPLGLAAHWRGFPGVGKHSLYPIEYSGATGTTTWYGSSCSGIFGEVRA